MWRGRGEGEESITLHLSSTRQFFPPGVSIPVRDDNDMTLFLSPVGACFGKLGVLGGSTISVCVCVQMQM